MRHLRQRRPRRSGALHTADDDSLATLRQPADLFDDGENAVACVCPLVAGDDEQPRIGCVPGGVDSCLRACVEGDRGHHARQDDLVVQPEHGEFDDLVGL